MVKDVNKTSWKRIHKRQKGVKGLNIICSLGSEEQSVVALLYKLKHTKQQESSCIVGTLWNGAAF